jgi:hypothetical protein
MVEDYVRPNPPPEKPFTLSDYRLGYYGASGVLLANPMLSDESIDRWERYNNELWGGRAFAVGQGLFFKGRPLTFGRHSREADVKISANPALDGSPEPEDGGISRVHFQLSPPFRESFYIRDLESTNGTFILSPDGAQRRLTAEDAGEYLLEGQTILVGAGLSTGIRISRSPGGELFLVKFRRPGKVVPIERGANGR